MSGGSPPKGTVTFLFSDIERSTELVRHVGEGACARLGALAKPGVADRSVAAERDLGERRIPDFDGRVRRYEPARPGTP
jgi:hypothetical protein